MSKADLDLHMIDAEAEYAQEVRDNPEKYEVTDADVVEIMSSFEAVESLDSLFN